MMTPTELSSRLNAMPRTLASGNSTISPAMTWESPYTRAMPSPTSSTRPVSIASTPVLASWISLEMTETISPTLNAMTAPLDELVPDALEAGAHAGGVDPVADPHDQPAQQAGVQGLLQDRLAARDPLEVMIQPAALLVGQRDRRAHVSVEAVRALLVQHAIGLLDGAQHAEAVVVVEDEEE